MHRIAETESGSMARTYLNAAGYGLPTAGTLTALRDALDSWRDGSADWVTDWDVAGDRCRALAAPMLGAPTDEIALLPAVSVGVGVVLGKLRPGDEIVVPEGEFASVLLPVLVAAKARGITVREVAFDDLANQLRPVTALVATSQVRSNDGRVQDLA